MQQARFLAGDPPACPQCETELDAVTGVCPACLWDHSQLLTPSSVTEERQQSYSERYRGPSPSSQMLMVTPTETGMARGRVFVLMAIATTVLLAAVVWQNVTFV